MQRERPQQPNHANPPGPERISFSTSNPPTPEERRDEENRRFLEQIDKRDAEKALKEIRENADKITDTILPKPDEK